MLTTERTVTPTKVFVDRVQSQFWLVSPSQAETVNVSTYFAAMHHSSLSVLSSDIPQHSYWLYSHVQTSGHN